MINKNWPSSVPSWKRQTNTLPWFDLPHANEQVAQKLASHEVSAEEAELLQKWIRDGYVVIDDCCESADIDSMIGSLEDLWTAPNAIPDLTFLGVRDNLESAPRNILHADLLKIDLDQRKKMLAISDWRIHGFEDLNAGARRIYQNRKVRRIVGLLFGRTANPIASINFMYGSQQALHQDMAVFHIYPLNYLVGAWLACEDIVAEAGPLVFYPGSHREPLFSDFNDYPQTNLRTVGAECGKSYQIHVDQVATKYPRHTFLGKKGQVLLWHGMLIHGGDAIQKRARSRRSMVVHSSVAGANKHNEVHGPFNW
ncbi:MAG: phytanoyl-CoA dioxygenase family protein [Bdellovibrionota bacterium]